MALASPVSAPTVLRTVDEDDTSGLVDLVDDSELASASGVQALKLSPELLARSLRILGDRAKDGLENRGSDLVGEAVEMPEALRCYLNLIGHYT
jgi:hypothetical protein